MIYCVNMLIFIKFHFVVAMSAFLWFFESVINASDFERITNGNSESVWYFTYKRSISGQSVNINIKKYVLCVFTV